MEILMELNISRNDIKTVENIYEKIISNFPESSFYYTAKVIWESWNYENFVIAVNISKKCISANQLQPNNANKKHLGIIYILLSNSYWKQDKISDGIECWKELISKQYMIEDANGLNLVLADMYLENGDRTKAINIYKELSNIEGENSKKQKAIKKLEELDSM